MPWSPQMSLAVLVCHLTDTVRTCYSWPVLPAPVDGILLYVPLFNCCNGRRNYGYSVAVFGTGTNCMTDSIGPAAAMQHEQTQLFVIMLFMSSICPERVFLWPSCLISCLHERSKYSDARGLIYYFFGNTVMV